MRTPYKLTEKFKRNPDIPASKDIAKKTSFLKEEKIRIVYHLLAGKIIPSFQEFKKPGEQKGAFVELSNSFEADPFQPPPKKQNLCALLFQLVRAEQVCIQSVKNSDREMKEIQMMRVSEENEINLSVSVHDTIRNSSKSIEEEKVSHKSGDQEDRQADLDYLSPFLVNKSSPDKLTKEEAIQVRDACLKSTKERIVEKTTIIQNRLDEVSSEYQRRQLAYSRNADAMSVEETEEYVKFCNQSLFKIHILEKRLAKHRGEVSERYAQMEKRMANDRRLAAAV